MRKKVKGGCLAFLTLFLAFALTGCSGKELEDRLFPTVVTFPEGDPEAIQKERQADSSKYLDYGQVRAVIVENAVAADRESMGRVLEYLEATPSFARNLLVFSGDPEILEYFSDEMKDAKGPGLEEETETEEEVFRLPEDLSGNYLEDLYKNRPDEESSPVTMADLLNEWYNGQELDVPKLIIKDGKILPEK
ncbi:MAG TPA: hypothetical protein IAB44_16400 [Candidatus Limivivens intestinipullorum]|uniref:Lipoprotein n=1 Tax=Candidatus Limivivens intestinipullorum TaxID=2840858 RepID=A0A9D1EW63_9FIRM|nr:hypothetical protein [Candidatus Limivivens intestinipullorum]